MSSRMHGRRIHSLIGVAQLLAAILLAKVLAETVYGYRSYFPADFESLFLMGKVAVFHGLYRAAFYAHIIVGPINILLAVFLMWSGSRKRFRSWHRRLGRIQVLLIMTVIVPSGLVMAADAYTGRIAAAGFALHSVATGYTAVMAMFTAMRRQFVVHRKWATRCLILLVAPLLLRIASGVTIALEIDSDATYRWTVWACWVLPWLAQEIRWQMQSRRASAPNLIVDSCNPINPQDGANACL